MCGLSALEYRGYDSAGIAAFENNELNIVKTVGRVHALAEKIDALGGIHSHCAIGHTRWATHGVPNDINSHPQKAGSVVLVHNGIIENYAELKSELQAKGVSFESQTDTEVASAVINAEYSVTHEPLSAIQRAMKKICGSYAFGILFIDIPSPKQKDKQFVAMHLFRQHLFDGKFAQELYECHSRQRMLFITELLQVLL